MRRPWGQRRPAQAGITLVELLVSMIILGVVSTMLITSWISLQRAFAFTSQDNKARATARDAINRISSEIRVAQPLTPAPTNTPSPTTTPFYIPVPTTTPYWSGTAAWCDGYNCTFYSAYNNPLAYSQSGDTGLGKVALTAIWLDTSGSKPQKTLYWQRDTNGILGLDAGDRKVALATDVVNTYSGINKQIFTYNLYDASAGYSTTNLLTSANVASVVSVQIDLVIDANVSHAPRYIELMTTVEPRNQGSN
jgi:type II secretory pathway pseudopilin PulG